MTGIFNRHSVFGRILRWAVVGVILALFIWYVAFQARFVIAGPSITLTDEPTILQHDQIVTILGKVEHVTSVTLNGRAIFIDNDGNFSESLVLENGYTIMTLAAKDRFGRKTTLERSFVYLP